MSDSRSYHGATLRIHPGFVISAISSERRRVTRKKSAHRRSLSCGLCVRLIPGSNTTLVSETLFVSLSVTAIGAVSAVIRGNPSVVLVVINTASSSLTTSISGETKILPTESDTIPWVGFSNFQLFDARLFGVSISEILQNERLFSH